jgi:hypothetical protein
MAPAAALLGAPQTPQVVSPAPIKAPQLRHTLGRPAVGGWYVWLSDTTLVESFKRDSTMKLAESRNQALEAKRAKKAEETGKPATPAHGL